MASRHTLKSINRFVFHFGYDPKCPLEGDLGALSLSIVQRMSCQLLKILRYKNNDFQAKISLKIAALGRRKNLHLHSRSTGFLADVSKFVPILRFQK